MDVEGYDYWWFRHHSDATTFIAVWDPLGRCWFVPANPSMIPDVIMMRSATKLGKVPRMVVGGGSIDQ